jgi:hypothetical protein
MDERMMNGRRLFCRAQTTAEAEFLWTTTTSSLCLPASPIHLSHNLEFHLLLLTVAIYKPSRLHFHHITPLFL